MPYFVVSGEDPTGQLRRVTWRDGELEGPSAIVDAVRELARAEVVVRFPTIAEGPVDLADGHLTEAALELVLDRVVVEEWYVPEDPVPPGAIP